MPVSPPVFLCCGDALYDLFVEAEVQSGAIALNGRVGGSPLNVAVCLARLQQASAFLCKNSTDLFGRRLSDFLQQEKVQMQWSVSTQRNTSLAVVEAGQDGVPSYAFYLAGSADVSLTTSELPAAFNDALKVIHFSSYSTVLQPVADALLNLARRERGSRIISHDVNIRASVEPDMSVWRQTQRDFGALAQLLKASDEDIALLQDRSEADIDSFVTEALGQGAELVLVTEGGAGAQAFTRNGDRVRVPSVPVDVVDTVGAGDTFQAACLYWLVERDAMRGPRLHLDGLNLTDMLDFAVRAASITCTRVGADVPSLDDLIPS